jgi:signal transduction histidine kinase
MAAHLHDSVLQTLALIQRESGNGAAVSSLARRQERELRTWLYGHNAGSERGALGEKLQAMCAEVEEAHHVPVDFVMVGNVDGNPTMESLVQASREAVVNAAKHSGAERIAVYAEARPDRVTVFVRDRGRGFDYAAVPEDRLGIRESIIKRLERSGGQASVRTEIGQGTEIEMVVER